MGLRLIGTSDFMGYEVNKLDTDSTYFETCNSKNIISFTRKRTEFEDPHAWWQFDFRFSGERRVSYDMDTGSILLRYTKLPEKKITEFINDYREILTRRAYLESGIDSLRPILELFPNGKYAVRLIQIDRPYLVTSEIVRKGEESDCLHAPQHRVDDANDDLYYDFDELMKVEASPNLLIPTVNLKRCKPHIVYELTELINDAELDDLPLMLVFREPYRYSKLHDQYHPDGYTKWRHEPPNFGFNGGHIYFSGNNYYILDGHHKAMAYAKTQCNPLAIEIECIYLDDKSYPDPFRKS